MNFKDYNSSQIVPQTTLLRKFQKLIKWEEENSFARIYIHKIHFNDGTYDDVLYLFTNDADKYTSIEEIKNVQYKAINIVLEHYIYGHCSVLGYYKNSNKIHVDFQYVAGSVMLSNVEFYSFTDEVEAF